MADELGERLVADGEAEANPGRGGGRQPTEVGRPLADRALAGPSGEGVVEADHAGVVREILVENGQPVEYGQRLFKLKQG